MTAPLTRGWCPSAYRPMMSGDGLVVRVKPPSSRITRDQATGLAELADQFGNGSVELTSRANLQLRGVRPEDHDALLAGLLGLSLIDPDADTDAKRNVIVQPFWRIGGLTDRVANRLNEIWQQLPALPAKFGFVVDTGRYPVLRDASADIRLERVEEGKILVLADGHSEGLAVEEEDVGETVIRLAHWFADVRGDDKRMAKVVAGAMVPERFTDTKRRTEAANLLLGPSAIGIMVGVPFGALSSDALGRLAGGSGVTGFRFAPARRMLIEGASSLSDPDIVLEDTDPILAVEACPGAPLCPQATVETRDLARRLAGMTKGNLHVSGCAKGCAHPGSADLTLVGRNGRFDLVKSGRANDDPLRTSIEAHDVAKTLQDLI